MNICCGGVFSEENIFTDNFTDIHDSSNNNDKHKHFTNNLFKRCLINEIRKKTEYLHRGQPYIMYHTTM